MFRSVSLHCSFHGHRCAGGLELHADIQVYGRPVRCWSCLSCDRAIHFRRSVGATYLPYFMCSMPIAVKTLTGFIVVHVLPLVRLVAQKSSPAVRRAEGGCRLTGAFGIYESRSYRDEARRVRDDLDKVVGGERGRGLVTHLAYGEQLTWGPKITGPGSSDVGAPLVRHGYGGTFVGIDHAGSPHSSKPQLSYFSFKLGVFYSDRFA
jgi:hypothetical protein